MKKIASLLIAAMVFATAAHATSKTEEDKFTQQIEREVRSTICYCANSVGHLALGKAWSGTAYYYYLTCSIPQFHPLTGAEVNPFHMTCTNFTIVPR